MWWENSILYVLSISAQLLMHPCFTCENCQKKKVFALLNKPTNNSQTEPYNEHLMLKQTSLNFLKVFAQKSRVELTLNSTVSCMINFFCAADSDLWALKMLIQINV